MSLVFSITRRDGVSGLLADLGSRLSSPDTLRQCGRSVQLVLADHFRRLASERHRPGQSPNYYLTAGERTLARDVRIDGTSAVVVIDQPGIARHYFGPARKSLRLDGSSDPTIRRASRSPGGADPTVLPTRRELLAAAAAGAGSAIEKGAGA